MRNLLAAALLVVAASSFADQPKPLAISLEPLGDSNGVVIARVIFRFANPRAITSAGLFLEGTFTQPGQVARSFRLAVPRKNDRMIWNHTVRRNGKIVRATRWSVLPDQRNEMAAEHPFVEGPTEIDARLVLEGDRGDPATVVSQATQSFAIRLTGEPYKIEEAVDEIVEEPDFRDAVVVEAARDPAGAVTLRGMPRHDGPGLYALQVDVLPTVKRVELWVGEKKVLARNAPPYDVELDLGASPARVALRAVAYDAGGRYLDSDAFVVNEEQGSHCLGVVLTHTTAAGVSHFKLTVRNPQDVPLQQIALWDGDTRLHSWAGPPLTWSVANDGLAGVTSVRAVVVADGCEASDTRLLKSGPGLGR
jgi:hypothetical protein